MSAPNTDRASRMRRAAKYLVPPAMVLAIVVGSEAVAAFMNRAAREPVWPVLIDFQELLRARGTIRQEGGTQTLSYLDPHLGFERDPAVLANLGDGMIPGFVIYGDDGDDSAMRIVALGGSTTDPTDAANWPKQLHRILEQDGVRNVVYNGGVSGYTSSQELLKLIRDALPLSPDLVVVLNGVNDAGFVHSVANHPMVHPYQERAFMEFRGRRNPVLLPNLARAWQRWRLSRSSALYRVEGVNYGPRVDATDYQWWRRNVGLMQACAAQEGVRFVCVLQPVLGVGDYTPTERETALLEDAKRMFGGQYLDLLRAYYDGAKPIAAELDYVHDLTDVFANETDRYRDARHPNDAGYRQIAEAIAVIVRTERDKAGPRE